jgi:hypothetical protein
VLEDTDDAFAERRSSRCESLMKLVVAERAVPFTTAVVSPK